MVKLININRIPLFNIGTTLAGMYIGYNHGVGIETSCNLDKILTMGPALTALGVTPLAMFSGKAFKKTGLSSLELGIADSAIRIRADSAISASTTAKDIGAETLTTTGKTILESAVGYGIGYGLGYLTKIYS